MHIAPVNSYRHVWTLPPFYGKVQVGNYQEIGAIRKRFPLQKPMWEKTNLTIRYLYHENIS